jgi:hypothetical protein
MLQTTRTFASSLVVLLLLAALAPAPAYAWPFGNAVHLHPRAAQAQDGRITVYLFNKSDRFRDVNVAGRVYTVMPHNYLTIKAPVGTNVLAGTATICVHKGDLLFSITPDRNNRTVAID